MSRLKERKEKNCLNCNAEVQGRFCHNCGQENIEPKESVWDLISHFFKDITHFDGKFFSTLKFLIIRPGFISKEYMVGRRASYVNPIRMYIFTSAFFFLIFFSFTKIDKNIIISELKVSGKTMAQIEAMDSLTFSTYINKANKDIGRQNALKTKADIKYYMDTSLEKGEIHFTNADYKSKAQYDSAVKAGSAKDNWLRRQLIYKEIEVNEKYGNDIGQGFKDYANILMHSLPQMFFILLPLFAFILKLLYIRRKNYYYVDHIIFSIHFYILAFIIMLLLFGLIKVNNELNWTLINIAEVILGLGIFFYLYKAMRTFYQQRRAKTVFKFLILFLLLFIILGLLALAFILLSVFKL